MEMDTIAIFQNLAYPIAVSVVLFLSIAYFGKHLLKEMQEREKGNEQLRADYIEYLQKCNTELTQALKDNTAALARFSKILEIIEHKLYSNGEHQPD